MGKPLVSFEWQPCGYGCGKPWRPFAGTKLIGHARCAATPELIADIKALIERFPLVGYDRLARDFGVSTAVLRSWIRPRRRHG